MEGKTKKPMHRGHNEGNIRQRTDGRWEVRLSAGIDYKTCLLYTSDAADE